MRFYLRNSQLENEENLTMEFKGHRTFAPQEQSMANRDENNRPTRRHISKYCCGMLNTGKGGLILCGILDEGTVAGIMMSPFQRDHFVLSVQSEFAKFDPPVPPHLYSIGFVPVIENPDDEPDDDTNWETQLNENQPHFLGTVRFCWCDNESLAALSKGVMYNFYVIEIEIKEWDKSDPRNQELFPSNVSYMAFSF